MSDRHPMTGNEMSGSETGGLEHHAYDVIVIGAGGAGLRAAIAAHDAGARTAIVCKSLLGKAHTVMAEGGIAWMRAGSDEQSRPTEAPLLAMTSGLRLRRSSICWSQRRGRPVAITRVMPASTISLAAAMFPGCATLPAPRKVPSRSVATRVGFMIQPYRGRQALTGQGCGPQILRVTSRSQGGWPG